MRTAKEMEEYCIANGFLTRKKSVLKHFQIIEKQLKPDETVKVSLITNGVYNGQQIVMGGTVAIAFTNKRLIYAQEGGFLLGTQLKIVNLDQVNDIHKDSFGLTFGKIKIDTIRENVVIPILKEQIDRAFYEISSIIDDYKNNAPKTTVQQISSADELLKFKELLDLGAISNEEFEAKKKQILGL